MPLRSRKTASLNGSFRHSKTRVSGRMYFRHLRGRCGSFETGCHWYNHERPLSALGYRSLVHNTERNNQARCFDCKGAFRITTDGRVIG
jgi:transposase InsO family protein